MTRTPRRSTALLALASLLGGIAWAAASPAQHALAASRVTVANEFGENKADTTFSTQITVSGSGFQSVQGAFGGLYVAFGTVGSGWQPSKGGVSGADFRYVPDSESQDNAGFQRYIAFPGSSTAGEAHATMSDAGGWTVTMTVPGPTFQTTGRSGGIDTVDCRRVTCGVITFGGHGVTNANNETFTPVTFADIYSDRTGTDDPASDDAPDDDASDDGAAGDAVADGEASDGERDGGSAESPEPETAAEPTLEVDRTTAVVGRVMTFTARGFTPGEQVIGALGAGLAGVGPLVAGAQGEVAGALQLPSDLRAGTHVFTMTGAASSLRVEEQFQVAAAPAVPASSETADDGAAWPPSGEWLALGVAALVLVAVIVVGVVTAARDRRGRRRVAAIEPSAAPSPVHEAAASSAAASSLGRGVPAAALPAPPAGAPSSPAPVAPARAGSNGEGPR